MRMYVYIYTRDYTRSPVVTMGWLDVFMCKERHHPHPTPPQTTPLWPPANGYNQGYIYIYTYVVLVSDLVISLAPVMRFRIFWVC